MPSWDAKCILTEMYDGFREATAVRKTLYRALNLPHLIVDVSISTFYERLEISHLNVHAQIYTCMQYPPVKV